MTCGAVQLLLRDLDTVLSTTTGCRIDAPLPPPARFAQKLRKTARRLLGEWHAVKPPARFRMRWERFAPAVSPHPACAVAAEYPNLPT
jgi:hypothetical protein